MTIYTGVADANGDFTIPFSTNYTGGQKVTVTAEKDDATKTIELFAPSDAVGGGNIIFSGTLNNFPVSIGGVKLKGFTGAIGNKAFDASVAGVFGGFATSLEIDEGVTSLGTGAFLSWAACTTLKLPGTLNSIGESAFQFWSALRAINLPEGIATIARSAFLNASAVKSIDLPTTITSIGDFAFTNLTGCDVVVCRKLSPPTLSSSAFNGLKSTCVFRVPAASVAAYQAAANWSAFASRIQAI